jgi:hypothetical protein
MQTYEITFNENTDIGREIFAFLRQYKNYVKLKEPTKLSKEEFDAKILRAREQYARGEYTEVGPDDDIVKYIEEL